MFVLAPYPADARPRNTCADPAPPCRQQGSGPGRVPLVAPTLRGHLPAETPGYCAPTVNTSPFEEITPIGVRGGL